MSQKHPQRTHTRPDRQHGLIRNKMRCSFANGERYGSIYSNKLGWCVFFQQFIFVLDIYRHHTNQVTGLRGNSQQAEPHIAVPTRESLTKEALFHISHICIEYTFYRIPLEIKFNTRYTAVYICPLLNDIKNETVCNAWNSSSCYHIVMKEKKTN